MKFVIEFDLPWYLQSSIGPAIGSFLYDVGGFPLPFFSTGVLAFVIAIMLIFSIPDVQNENYQTVETSGKMLTVRGIITVCE